jgi:hypothetical protein
MAGISPTTLTPGSTVHQLVRNSPRFLEPKGSFLCSHQPDICRILSNTDSVHASQVYYFDTHFKIDLPSTPLSSWSPCFTVPHRNFVRISLPAIRTSLSAHIILHTITLIMISEVKILKLLNMQFSPAFLSSSATYSRSPSASVLPKICENNFQPHTERGSSCFT